MLAKFESHHWTDGDGKPAGGQAAGTGFEIIWQKGKLVADDGQRIEPNGAFVETIIAVAKDRLGYYQTTMFACSDNAEAISHLELALYALNRRTMAREARAVEGTHEV